VIAKLKAENEKAAQAHAAIRAMPGLVQENANLRRQLAEARSRLHSRVDQDQEPGACGDRAGDADGLEQNGGRRSPIDQNDTTAFYWFGLLSAVARKH
jgi:hypothetical protein